MNRQPLLIPFVNHLQKNLCHYAKKDDGNRHLTKFYIVDFMVNCRKL